jgi:dolichyl-diphosphooligosaccharide--protein glycosyltransferase
MHRVRGLCAAAVTLGLFALAFGLRVLNVGYVLGGAGVRFPSGRDELYHVRKIVYQVLRFPETLDFDPYVSFPFGAKPVWPPFLDQAIAAGVRALGVAGDALAVERAIVWWPPLLGAITVALLVEIARRRFSLAAAAVAGLVLAVAPAHHVHSQLGQVDHQVVVGFFTVLLLGGAMAWHAAPRAGLAVGVGAVMAASLVSSPGALLPILPVQAATGLWVLAASERESAVTRARTAALAHAVAALLVAPACWVAGGFPDLGPYSPLVLSRFQPVWFAACAVALATLAGLFAQSAAGASRPRRVATVAGLAAGLGALALAIPPLRETLAYAGGFFTHEEAFLTTVRETQPLFFPEGRFDAAFALRSLGPALFAFPLAWGFLAVRGGLDGNARPALFVLLVWSAALGALALAQERFANAFAPGLALVLGVAVTELHGALGARRLAHAVALGAVVVLVAPTLPPYHSLFRYSRFVIEQGRDFVPADSRRKVVVEEAARFLREASPETAGFLDVSQRPAYGVLTSWDDGHLVRYRAERPTVQDNFGSYADRRAWDLARRYFDAEDEEAAYAIAEQLSARFTVATGQGSGQRRDASPRSLASRLWRRLGGAEPSGGGAPALARHRLFWVGDRSGRPRDRERPAVDRVAVFEIVPGVLVEGRAEPGARVTVALELQAGSGRLWYRARSEASAAGRYRIRLPYPTDAPVSREVGARGVYRLESGGREAALEVREAEVRAGATVVGPGLGEEGA